MSDAIKSGKASKRGAPTPLNLKSRIGQPSAPLADHAFRSAIPTAVGNRGSRSTTAVPAAAEEGLGLAVTTDTPVSSSSQGSRTPVSARSTTTGPVRPARPAESGLLSDVAIPSPSLRASHDLGSYTFGASRPSSYAPSVASTASRDPHYAAQAQGRRFTPPTFNSMREPAGAPVESADIVGDIQFRSAPTTPTEGRVRTLYSGTGPSPPPLRSPTYMASEAGRRKSLVNPEDYLPGLPASANAGRALAAGFDPVLPYKPSVSGVASISAPTESSGSN